MTARPRKTGGINLGSAFAAAGGAIIQTAEASMPAYAQHVADTRQIAPNPLNAREIDPQSPAIKRLAESMKSDGQLQAVPVVPRADFLSWEGFGKYAELIGDARYVVIGGGRRRAAAEVAGLARMDISIKSGLTRETFLRMTVIENIEREDLTPLEEARQLQTLRDATGDSYAELGAQLNGRTKGWVAQRLDLLKLSERLQRELASDAEDSMTVTQARRLLKRIREEAGERDDATVPADRQWQLWEELRDAERLPGKRDDGAVPRLPGKQGTDPAPVVDSNMPAAVSASSGQPVSDGPAVPTQSSPRDHAGQGVVLIRVDTPVTDIVRALQAKMSPGKWAEFVIEVNAS